MNTKSLLAWVALASLAVAQPVAAATRSADSLPQHGVQATDRIGSISGPAEFQADDDDDDTAELLGIFVVIALIAIAIWGLAGNNKSSG